MSLTKRPVILVAPLDWGLGHATRCIPIIQCLLQEGASVVIAASGPQKALLAVEFPQLEYLPLQGYGIQYASGRTGTLLKLLAQIPTIYYSIARENAWLHQLLATRKIDAIISDNRYGLHHPNCLSVIITHQLRIKSPFGRMSENWLQKWNYRFIEKFNTCWIPDFKEQAKALAGTLSHPETMPKNEVTYLGPLSRFEASPASTEKKPFILILLSGPEPQRTQLEAILIQQAKSLPHHFILVRGLPENKEAPTTINHLISYPHLPAESLHTLIQEAELVIARCGYSTVMDLFCMGKKAILIPTPAQTEQEYLATYLSAQHPFFVTAKQEEISLPYLIAAASNLPLPAPNNDMLYKKEISSWYLANFGHQ